jgi:hypothetical protein
LGDYLLENEKEEEMKTLNLRKLTRIHWSLFSLAMLGVAFLLTTQPARRWAHNHVAASEAALPPQSRTGPRAPVTATEPTAQNVRAPKPPCSAEKKAKVLAQATRGPKPKEGADFELIDCSLTLGPTDVITKRLIFEGANASGVTVDCGGATINSGRGYNPSNPYMVEIRSFNKGPGSYERPENVTLRNCKIIGPVAVYGESGEEVESSRRPDYVTRVRNNAPRRIVFDRVTITGVGGKTITLLYLYSGVSDFQMLNSEINGSSGNALNIYLDAESYRNTFRNNYIHATTERRELMAIDGSSYNTIVNNRFSALNNGGIYLYRNCGERGVIRHSTPSHNTIVNNFFYYDKYDGDNPAIYVGSRNGRSSWSYDCDDDKGYPYGSSASNYDHAQFNVVMQNQIRKRSVSDMIKVGQPLAGIIPGTREPIFLNINTPNYLDHNEVVGAEITRRAGCYISDGLPNFIPDGQFVNLFHNPNGEPACRGYRLMCRDGVLTRSNDSPCQVSQVGYVDFECQGTSNSGCQKTVVVPASKQIIGAKAACNLELGTVSSTDLNKVPVNLVQVLRASDKVLEGRCTLGSASIRNGQAAVNGLNGLNRVSFGCRERDSDGGDCHIKGRLYYR